MNCPTISSILSKNLKLLRLRPDKLLSLTFLYFFFNYFIFSLICLCVQTNPASSSRLALFSKTGLLCTQLFRRSCIFSSSQILISRKTSLSSHVEPQQPFLNVSVLHGFKKIKRVYWASFYIFCTCARRKLTRVRPGSNPQTKVD